MKLIGLLMGALLLTTVTCIPQAFCSQEEAEYVGDSTCMECHEDIYESFWKNIHGVKADRRTPAAMYKGFVCESCHGPGGIHSENGEGGDILDLRVRSDAEPDLKNNVCLQCHSKGKQALWPKSTHETRQLTCANCHKVHGNQVKYMAESKQSKLCASCHQAIRPLLMRQSHHPIREGKMKCSDCHNSHGTIADKLIDAQYINLKCFECHAKIRGPYLWEHPPVTEDCLTCHVPHGSSRDFLLNAKMPYLCQRCHSNSGHPGELQARSPANQNQSVYRVLNNRGFYRGCLNCHPQIHGSNHPSGKGLTR